MKILLCSQRIDYLENYKEIRDSLDEQIIKLMNLCGYIILPIPNIPYNTEELLIYLKGIDGILLSGGNSLGVYQNKDDNDKLLIEYALKYDVPLLGICRGMQSVLNYYGIELKKIDGHIRTYHEMVINGKKISINSFHEYGVSCIPECFEGLQVDDGTYEFIKHKSKKITAFMWHPERFDEFREEDIEIIKEAFGG